MDNTNDYIANTTANRVPRTFLTWGTLLKADMIAVTEARRKSAEALEKVDQLVKEATASKSGKDKGNRTRRIVEYLRDGIRYAESISTANNFAEAAVSLLRVIIEQEISRRQNNEQIVVAYCMLSSATFTIRYIERSQMQKPSQWTFPKWLFFSAKSKAKHDLLKGDISKYIDSLQADTQFHSLVQEYQELNKQLAEKIIQDGGILSDAVDISPLKRRFRDRIEMWILPFLENILLHQFEALVGRPYANYNAYNNGKGSDQADEEISAPTVQFDNKTVEDIQWMDMIDTLKELFIQFHLRMLSLLRGWKKQKINCQVMIDSFSGGLFAGWHTAYMGDRNFKHMIDILIHSDNLDSGNETPTDDQVPSQPHVHNGLQGPPEIQYSLFEETESDNDGENLSLNGHQHSRSGSSENNAPNKVLSSDSTFGDKELPENNDNWDARKQDMEFNFDNDDSLTLQALNKSQPQVYSDSAYNGSEYNNDQGQRWQELEQEQEQKQSDAYGY
ncbi:hypothetical protein F5879DRAFT_926693 [Lentinula edodes]|nr:hypothetical protein F5879DRAFT_926693 [Lentinula edodes]